MRLLGYGEEALALAAVSVGLPTVLKRLDDTSDPDEAVVFYRPSFGARSGTPGRPRPDFGAFDAIIGTHEGTYLVEAKWSSSSELQRGALTLDSEQVRRHRVLRSYMETWRELSPGTWRDFIRTRGVGQITLEDGLRLPSPGTALAANLEFILTETEDCGPVQDVLLVSASGSGAPGGVQPPVGFTLVRVPWESVGGAGFVSLNLGRPNPSSR